MHLNKLYPNILVNMGKELYVKERVHKIGQRVSDVYI